MYDNIPTIAEFNLRAEMSTKGQRKISAYFAVSESESQILGSEFLPFIETLERGAFKEVLATNPDVIFTKDHDFGDVYARTANGSLMLREDSIGLYGFANLLDTPEAETLWTNIESGLLSQCSFCFTVRQDDQTFDVNDEGIETRRIHRIHSLVEVSAISSWGAYSETNIHARELEYRAFGAYQKPKPKRQVRKLTRNQIIKRRI